jgi:hypothetical protein
VSLLRNNNSKRDCDLNLDAFYSVFHQIINYERMTRDLSYFAAADAGGGEGEGLVFQTLATFI